MGKKTTGEEREEEKNKDIIPVCPQTASEAKDCRAVFAGFCLSVCLTASISVHACACASVCMYVCMCVSVCVCEYVYV